MKTQLHYIAWIVFSASTFSCYSQNAVVKSEHPISNVYFDALSDQDKVKYLQSVLDGTYQLKVADPNYSPLLNLELLSIVANDRMQSSAQTIDIDANTKLYLPSFDQIESESFRPLKPIVYATGPINSNDDN